MISCVNSKCPDEQHIGHLTSNSTIQWHVGVRRGRCQTKSIITVIMYNLCVFSRLEGVLISKLGKISEMYKVTYCIISDKGIVENQFSMS